MVRLFVIRHGEREDHVNTKWQDYAHRPHDSPLSLQGRNQAKTCASYLENKLSGSTLKRRIICLSSPLIRCVATAKLILLALGLESEVNLKVEPGICEANGFLRNRMMGLHAQSNEVNPLTGQPRSLVTPVLLGPGDLVEAARPVFVDFTHKPLMKVKYSNDGYELLKSFQPKEVETRLLPREVKMTTFIPKFQSWLDKQQKKTQDDEELICLIVSHGAVCSTFAKLLVNPEEEEVLMGYVSTMEIERVSPNVFEMISVWHLEDPGSTLA